MCNIYRQTNTRFYLSRAAHSVEFRERRKRITVKQCIDFSILSKRVKDGTINFNGDWESWTMSHWCGPLKQVPWLQENVLQSNLAVSECSIRV